MMRGKPLTIIVVVFLLIVWPALAFVVQHQRQHHCAASINNDNKKTRQSRVSHLHSSEKDEGKDVDAATKASWYAVEAFGKVFGSAASKSETTTPLADRPPSSLKETTQRIQADNQREYFLSGEVDELIYAEDCTFADPFVSFRGRDRFVENLRNLGSFITKYSAKPLSYDVDGNVVTTKFMVKLQLNLPWKPVLAWPWGVRCEIDPATNLITLHKESVSESLIKIYYTSAVFRDLK